VRVVGRAHEQPPGRIDVRLVVVVHG
jgi:hypothetical protein